MWTYALLVLSQFSLWSQFVLRTCYMRFLTGKATSISEVCSSRHVGLIASPPKLYSSSTLKAIRKNTTPSRLPYDLWAKLKDLGIRKPTRSKRKRKGNRSTNNDTQMKCCLLAQYLLPQPFLWRTLDLYVQKWMNYMLL